MIISKGKLLKDQLQDEIIVITGAGGGIGFEAARSLVWLGASVVIAEIDKGKGKAAENKINEEFGSQKAHFFYTDVGEESSIKSLKNFVIKKFGKIDAIINNATIAPIGAIEAVGIDNWDKSYKTNLRGPVLLTKYFLPEMKKQNKGVIAFVSSSGAAPYLGVYEVFKTSQVELSNTLSAELENSNVIVYTIGPGIVKTDTAMNAIRQIAHLYGKSIDEFFEMNKSMLINPEEAGAGFAASIVLAKKYKGQEISSIQSLKDAGIDIGVNDQEDNVITLSKDQLEKLEILFQKIKTTYFEQKMGWYKRNIFERQWVIRDFKKNTGSTPEDFIDYFTNFETLLNNGNISHDNIQSLELAKLSKYYQHQEELLRGFEKDKDKLKEGIITIETWIKEVADFNNYISENIYGNKLS